MSFACHVMRNAVPGFVERRAFALGAEPADFLCEHRAPRTVEIKTSIQGRPEPLALETSQRGHLHRDRVTVIARRIDAGLRDEPILNAMQQDVSASGRTPQKMDLSCLHIIYGLRSCALREDRIAGQQTNDPR